MSERCVYCWRDHSRKSRYCSNECRDADNRHERDVLLTRAEVAAIPEAQDRVTPLSVPIVCARSPRYIGTSRKQELRAVAINSRDRWYCSLCGARVRVVA